MTTRERPGAALHRQPVDRMAVARRRGVPGLGHRPARPVEAMVAFRGRSGR